MLGVLLLTSCLEDENEQAYQKINPEIEAAKSWYESFDKEYQPAENARQSSKPKGKPDWSQSKIYRQADGKKVIEVRFNFDQIDIPSHLKTEELSKNSVLQTLLLYPKENGTYIPYFLAIYPDDPHFYFEPEDFHRGAYQSIPEEFSGVYRFYRWNGNFIGGWRIKDGVKTHRLKEFKSITTSKSSRISSGTLYCYVIETTWYTYTCFEGFGCTTPQEDGRDITGVECEYVLAAPSPMDPDTGGGGGGTPPSGNDCEQPEGNILDVLVECEEEETDAQEAIDYIEKTFRKINDCEKDIIISNLHRFPSIIQIFNNSVIAEEMTSGLFSSNNQEVWNNCGDAFRHSFWNALNVISVPLDLAIELPTAHECSGYNRLEKEMDLYNNSTGRDIGLENMNLSINNWSDVLILSEIVLQNLKDGKMRIIFPRASDNSVLIESKIVSSYEFCK